MPFGGLFGRAVGTAAAHVTGAIEGLSDSECDARARDWGRAAGFVGMVATFDAAEMGLQAIDLIDAVDGATAASDVASTGATLASGSPHDIHFGYEGPSGQNPNLSTSDGKAVWQGTNGEYHPQNDPAKTISYTELKGAPPTR